MCRSVALGGGLLALKLAHALARMLSVGLKKDQQLVNKRGILRVDRLGCPVQSISNHDVQIPLTRLNLFPVELAPPANPSPIFAAQIRWLLLVEQQLCELVVVELKLV